MHDREQDPHFRAIADSLRSFRASDFLCDTVLVADGGREFRAHSIVLAAASPVFRERFAASGAGGTILLAGFDSEVVEIALDAIYREELRLPEVYVDEGELRRLFLVLENLGLSGKRLSDCRIAFISSDRTQQDGPTESLDTIESDEIHESNPDACKQTFESYLHSAVAAVDETTPAETNSMTPFPGVKELNVLSRANAKSDDAACYFFADPMESKDHQLDADESYSPDTVGDWREMVQDGTVLQHQNKQSLKSQNHGAMKPKSTILTLVPVSDAQSQNGAVSTFHASTSPTTSELRLPGDVRYVTIVRPARLGEPEGPDPQATEEYVSGPLKAHVCGACGKAFSQPNYLHVHMRCHSGERPYACEVCGRAFTQRANLHRHAQTHSGERSHLCELCGKGFIQKVALQDHMELHGDACSAAPLRHSCKPCGAAFQDRRSLRRHLSTGHPELLRRTAKSSWVCRTCGRSYKTSSGLRMHARSHTGAMHACMMCMKSYVSAALLRQHVATHTRERQFRCEECGKTFVYRSALHVHRRTHTGEKPYRCAQCGRTYAQFGHLQSHARTHSGERPYACEQCGKAYRQRVDLRLHCKRSVKCVTAAGGVV